MKRPNSDPCRAAIPPVGGSAQLPRRDALKLLAAATAGGLLPGCSRSPRRSAPTTGRVIVLAFDGMDPKLLQNLIDAGRTPHFASLAGCGSFAPIATSDPPQTPVAFANIISGCDARVHQVFDFIHRDPKPQGLLSVRPFFSTSGVELPASSWAISMGKWRLALSGERPQLLRRGGAYWQPLVRHGHNASVFFLPSNYPPQGAAGPGRLAATSGMGTPDLLGGYGVFTLITPDAPAEGRQVTGGRLLHADLAGEKHRAEVEFEGPENFLVNPDKIDGPVPKMSVPMTIVRDPQRDLVKINLGGERLLLKPGEWSRWVTLTFATQVPAATALEWLQAPTSVSGMVRLFVKNVHPKCEIYVSPINFDPLRAAGPISQPAGLAQEIVRDAGRYATLGIPEDHNALQQEALTEDEFLSQAYLVHDERVEHYRRALAGFEEGCLFYYFGTTDLVSHMFWRDRDPGHPGRLPAQGDRYAHVIDDLYVHMDQAVGETLHQLRDEDTLIVLSDHGFTSFRRSVNLNTLLLEAGYLALRAGVRPGPDTDILNPMRVDWGRTRVYAIGINSVYVNLRGREKHGIVAPGAEQRELVTAIARLLVELRDDNAHDRAQPIRSAVDVAQAFPGADPSVAPDLIIGYEHNYRTGWDTVLGGVPERIFEDNLKRWSGDHCVASQLVPGILLSNRRLAVEAPSLQDIGPTILDLCGVARPAEMAGRPVL
jgi:predicted AlkP superfamily phosphohydrolase/phosphomutase